MDETFVCWCLLFLVLLWRQLCRLKPVEWVLHCFGPLTPLLQWYTWLFVGLGALLARTLVDIAVYDYGRFEFLQKQALDLVPGLSEEERRQLAIHPCLRCFSLLAPLAGALAFLIVAKQVYANIMFGRRLREGKLRWKPTIRQNMVLLVVAMPAVFIVMAVRSELRAWAVMTGSAWLPYSRQAEPELSWEKVKTLQMSTYTTDLELAAAFQYFTVWSFAHLCASYLVQAPSDYRFTLKWAGLQGVYLYVIVGLLRTAGDFFVAVLRERDLHVPLADAVQEKALASTGQLFTVATLLCVYNMAIVSRMAILTHHLGRVSLKFLATRLLLLVAQIQLQVLTALCVGSSLHVAAMKMPKPLCVVGLMIDAWDLSPYRAKLLHASLLTFECLGVALFNYAAWRPEERIYQLDEDWGVEDPHGGGYAVLPP